MLQLGTPVQFYGMDVPSLWGIILFVLVVLMVSHVHCFGWDHRSMDREVALLWLGEQGSETTWLHLLLSAEAWLPDLWSGDVTSHLICVLIFIIVSVAKLNVYSSGVFLATCWVNFLDDNVFTLHWVLSMADSFGIGCTYVHMYTNLCFMVFIEIIGNEWCWIFTAV